VARTDFVLPRLLAEDAVFVLFNPPLGRMEKALVEFCRDLPADRDLVFAGIMCFFVFSIAAAAPRRY
jgi:hypothetical protein